MNAPTKGEIIATFARGVMLRAPMPDNYPWIQAHLREGDQKEFDDAKAECPDEALYPMGIIQATIWIEDELAAYWDSILMPGKSAFYPMRAWAFSTSHVVEKHKIKFARMSREVFEFLWLLEHPWVRHAYVNPWDGYTRCLKWQAKYFNAEKICEMTINGEPYSGYILPRPKVAEEEK
jgi:hypothetical protein